ncbi:hypothetical protein LMG24076_00014 [Trinickia soli]|nr:hypothetical protein LMG24076_00014 [Trinickia soli]
MIYDGALTMCCFSDLANSVAGVRIMEKET